MRISVVTFAQVREIVGAQEIQMEFDPGATVGDLLSRLTRQHPELQKILTRCTISINHEYADAESPLLENSEVGLIPPVSGG